MTKMTMYAVKLKNGKLAQCPALAKPLIADKENLHKIKEILDLVKNYPGFEKAKIVKLKEVFL